MAAVWDERKGLKDILALYEKFSEDYQFIIIGLTIEQIRKIPKKIIGIERTNNIFELIELYSMADIFINPTYEDNYPTTNIEAISCGTAVVTYDTGGSPESAQLFGKIVPKGNVDMLYESIRLYKYLTIANKENLDSYKMVLEYLEKSYCF